jgi:hypothetical protein
VAEQIEKGRTEHSRREKIKTMLQQESRRFKGTPSDRQRTRERLKSQLAMSFWVGLSVDDFLRKIPPDEAKIIRAALEDMTP